MSAPPMVGISSFAAARNYLAADATVCQGSEQFIVLVALQVISIVDSAEQFICGTLPVGPAAGWFLRRDIDTTGPVVGFTFGAQYTGAETVPFSAPMAGIMGRTLLLGCLFDGTNNTIRAFFNGAVQGEATGIVGAYAPSTAAFCLGDIPGGISAGTTDRIISVGYFEGAVGDQFVANAWNVFRKTGSMYQAGLALDPAGLGYIYEASDIAAPPTLTHPTTWPNTGTVAAGDLTFSGATNAVLSFTVDQDPDFGVAAAGIAP